MTTSKTQDTPDPKTAAAKLAAMIPAPEDVTAEPSGSSIAKQEDVQSPPPNPEIEVGSITAGGPAPPLTTFEPEPEKKTSRRGAKKTTKPTAAGTAAKRAVQKMLPANVRVLVYKRNRTGKMAYISDYSANDLAEQGSIERFLHEYVVPEYEYGEYAVYYQEPGKEPTAVGSVPIEEPASHRRRRTNGGGETKELLELFLERDQRAKAEAADRKTPIDEMKETLAFLQTMTGADKEKPSMDPMLMMMMMQMNRQPEPPRGPDPILLKIIDRLDRMEDHASVAAMLPPPPPPPAPQADPMEGFASMMKVLSDQNHQNTQVLLQAFGSRETRNPIEDLATIMKLNGAVDDRMTTRDFMTLLPQLKSMIAPDQGKSSIGDALETIRAMKLLEREFGVNQGDQAASSFWDFLKEFVHSDAGARIAEAITAQESSKKLEEQRTRRQLADTNEDEEEQRGIRVPESYEEYARKLNNAAQASERLEALIKGLQHLAMHADFRPYIAKIFVLAKQNRRIEMIDLLAKFLEGLIELEVLDGDACQQALDDLQEYWTLVRKQLGMPDIPEVYPEGHPKAQAREGDESGEYELDDDEDDEEGVDPPRQRRRNPERDREPMAPTAAQQHAQAELDAARAEASATEPATAPG